MTNTTHKITKRDTEIIHFINEFGFCVLRQINKRFGLSSHRAYKVLKRLRLMSLVEHERTFHNEPGIFKASKSGASYTNLPPLKNFSFSEYGHQLAIIDVYLKLKEIYREAHWTSERQLVKESCAKGFGKRGHVPDGILILPDKRAAIEVELWMKGSARLKKILREHATSQDFDEVWYFCSPKIITAFKAHVERMDFIKVYNIERFLSDT